MFALPPGQVAKPFTLADQVALNAAMVADYAATVKPIAPITPPRQVRLFVCAWGQGEGGGAFHYVALNLVGVGCGGCHHMVARTYPATVKPIAPITPPR